MSDQRAQGSTDPASSPRPALPERRGPADLPAFGAPHGSDRRVGYGKGWVLVAGMVCLAAVFLGIVWNTAPRAWRGWLVGAGTAASLFFLLAPAAAVLSRRLLKRRRSPHGTERR